MRGRSSHCLSVPFSRSSHCLSLSFTNNHTVDMYLYAVYRNFYCHLDACLLSTSGTIHWVYTCLNRQSINRAIVWAMTESLDDVDASSKF